jgi:hypothetical protein
LTTFKVIVGPKSNRQKFRLHRDLMVQRSEFFRAARSEKWIKDKPTRPTSLEHEDPEVFAAYVHAVYFDRIRIEGLELEDDGDNGLFESNAALEETLPKKNGKIPTGRSLHRRKSYARFERLVKLYILSNMLLDDRTANMIVNEMMRTRKLVRWIPDHDAVQLLYRSTVAGDSMRNIICDYYVSLTINAPLLKDGYPADFLSDLASIFMRHKENRSLVPEKPTGPAYYCANWDPSQGQHRYHTGPGTEGKDLTEASDESHRSKRQCR